VASGLLADECGALLTEFFRARRSFAHQRPAAHLHHKRAA